jgi:Spy/CpxP family protein refolding chaperone
MKALHALAGAALLAAVAAGSLPAQDTTQAPVRRPRQMRLHAPGTGLEGGPAVRQRQGMRGSREQGMLSYSPQMLLARRDLLGLDDQQVMELEQLAENSRALHDQALEDVQERQAQLDEAFDVEQPDAAAVRQYAEALMDARQEAQLAMLDGAARARGVLTSEQQAKLAGYMEGRRMGARRGAMGQRGMRQRGMRMRRPRGEPGSLEFRRVRP